MIYPIVVYGDPVLRQRAKDVEEGTDLKALIQDMFETMYGAQGVGLAAPQIGKSIRLFVVDGSVIEDDETLQDFKKAFINPEMLEELGDEWEYEEG
jgi:peptide deformylase